MKWLKISILLLLTLTVMRIGSWAVGWMLVRLFGPSGRTVAVVSNLAGFAGFVLFLYLNLLPQEPIDIAAMLFGLVVFAIYTGTDFYWRPWEGRLQKKRIDASKEQAR